METNIDTLKLKGVSVMRLFPDLEASFRKADNLQLADDESVKPGLLEPLNLNNITVYEVRRTDQKAIAADQYIRELKKIREWTNKINWTVKDLVLEDSTLLLEDGICVLIPQPFPGENTVILHKEKEPIFSPKWNILSASYILEPGVCITARGKARFYAITFSSPQSAVTRTVS